MPPPDEDAFRRRREAVLDHACPFERALLARCADCSLAKRVLLAEREAIGCTQAAASERCHAYHEALRDAARFALRVEPGAPWPFSRQIRLQCGGLLGLRASLQAADDGTDDAGDADDAGDSADIACASIDAGALLQQALQHYGGVEALPYSRIMRAVVRYAPRRRAPR